MLQWNIYEIITVSSPLNHVSLRGRLRKLGLEQSFNILAENTEDKEGGIRIALLDENSLQSVIDYLQREIPDASAVCVLESVANPVLSKLRVNDADRYSL